MASLNELSEAVRASFGFLGISRRPQLIAPESYRGGFIVEYPGAGVRIEYLEYEFSVRKGDTEYFGATARGEFSGNMFTPEHLEQALPRIVKQVQTEVSACT